MIYICIPTTKERRAKLGICLRAIYASDFEEPFTVCVYENADGGWVKAFSKMIEGIDDVVWNINDDVIIAPDCLRILYDAYLRHFNGHDDGMVQPLDEQEHGTGATFAMAHARVFRENMCMEYIHYYCDVEMKIRLQNRAKFLYVPDAITEHRNVRECEENDDETYAISRSAFQHDKELFYKRLREGIS